MVAIKTELSQKTLDAVDRELELAQDTRPREHLGASSIGEYCSRKLWYRFRWAKEVSFDAATLKRFADGHAQEWVQAKRLGLVVFLQTVDPETGQQFSFSHLGGHFCGSCDGRIMGLLESPKTLHIWEHKSVGEKKFKELKKLLEGGCEKTVLESWDETYYAQAVVYMHFFKARRHFLTVSTPGGRESISCRTHANAKKAKQLIKRAQEVIYASEPPARDESYRCRWCDYKNICLQYESEQEIPQLNCRTCLFSTPEQSGGWSCGQTGETCPLATEQQRGCSHHLFIPALINSEQVGAGDNFEWIEYKTGRNHAGSGEIS